MTRPDKRRDSGNRPVKFKLHESVCQEIIRTVWPDAKRRPPRSQISKFLAHVELILQMTRDHIEGRPPRPAGHRAALLEVAAITRQLTQALNRLARSTYVELELELERAEREPVPVSPQDRPLTWDVLALQQACASIAERTEKRCSRGRQAANERNSGLYLLMDAFRDHYAGSDYRGDAIDFATLTLNTINCNVPESVEKFWRLLPKRVHYKTT